MENGIHLLGHFSALESRVSALLNELPLSLSGFQTTAVISVFLSALFMTTLIEPGWSAQQPVIQQGVPDPAPNSIADPYREPESELVLNEDSVLPLPNPELRDPRDESLFETLRVLSLRVPRSREDYVAKRARWAMAQARDGELIRPLLKRLEDDDWRIRAYAAYALGLGRIREAVPLLIRCIEHPVWRMRAMAAFALAHIGDPIAANALRKSLGDPAWQVRVAAVSFFAERSEYRSLLEELQLDENVVVRGAAIQALERMGN